MRALRSVLDFLYLLGGVGARWRSPPSPSSSPPRWAGASSA
ncbi:hypothetical protein [Teichococcus aestuarii]